MATLTVRTDSEVDKALAELTRGGIGKSEAIRQAVLAAARLRREATMLAQSQAAAADLEDVSEAKAVLADMAEFRAW